MLIGVDMNNSLVKKEYLLLTMSQRDRNIDALISKSGFLLLFSLFREEDCL